MVHGVEMMACITNLISYLLFCSWEAILVVADSKPFPQIHDVVESMNDDRIWVFAEWVRRRCQEQLAIKLTLIWLAVHGGCL